MLNFHIFKKNSPLFQKKLSLKNKNADRYFQVLIYWFKLVKMGQIEEIKV